MDQARQEAEALWQAVFGPDGSARAPGGKDVSGLLQALVENLPAIGYDRFAHAQLNDGNLVWPVCGPDLSRGP